MSDIIIKDEIAERNLELARESVSEGNFGGPILDLDVKAYHDFRDGKTSEAPSPFTDDAAMTTVMKDVEGEEVLCLAGGGGPDAAVFSLLGAKVTVFDLTPEQLDRDRVSAGHYGYDVTLIQGDMRDLSGLPQDHFARVIQPISSLYVPSLREVYRGVAKVLKPGGLYFCDYVYPILYMAENKGWDGEAYVLRFNQPHACGKILEKGDWLNFSEGEFFGEFNHRFSDIINGQIAEGLSIVGVWESPRPNRIESLNPPPGSDKHQHCVLPYGLSTVSKLLG